MTLQQGAYDGGSVPMDVAAKLKAFVRLERHSPNFVDCAIAALDAKTDAERTKLRGLGKLTGLGGDFLDAGAAVAKIGRTTGLTRGRVTAFELDNVVVGFDVGNLRFDNQIEIESAGELLFSDGGDSGSLIVDENGIPRFQLLQRFQKQPTAPTLYYVFDVLWCKEDDLTQKSVLETEKSLRTGFETRRRNSTWQLRRRGREGAVRTNQRKRDGGNHRQAQRQYLPARQADFRLAQD